MPLGIPDYHKSLDALHVGCIRPHAYFIPYRTEGTATLGIRDYSEYFKPLIGVWDFKFFPSVTELDGLSVSDIITDKKLPVPMNWQNALGEGFDTPNYTNINYPYPKDPPHVPTNNPAGFYSRKFTLDELVAPQTDDPNPLISPEFFLIYLLPVLFHLCLFPFQK